MIQTVFNRVGHLLVIIAIQVLVLNHICLWGYATPLLCFTFVCFTPLGAKMIPEMLMSFVLGFVLDMFTNTPGICAGAMSIVSFVQHYLLQSMSSKDSEEGMIPSVKELGIMHFSFYIAALLALGHIVCFSMEYFSFAPNIDMFLSLLCSYALSMVVSLTFLGLYGRL